MDSEGLSEGALPPPLADFCRRRLPALWAVDAKRFEALSWRRPVGLLSGSFNPLHPGHLALREAAEQVLGSPVDFELPVMNADKPALDFETVVARLRQFTGRPVLLTAAATFVEKARLLPGVVFVVGLDTAERIIEARFYGGSPERMHQVLDEVRRAGCRFLVAGRATAGSFRTLHDLALPGDCEELFDELSEAAFRHDISSTDLRGPSR